MIAINDVFHTLHSFRLGTRSHVTITAFVFFQMFQRKSTSNILCPLHSPPSLSSEDSSIESFTRSKLKFGIYMHYIFNRARTNPLNCGRNCQHVSCRKVRALSGCIARSKGASQSVTQGPHTNHSKSAYE